MIQELARIFNEIGLLLEIKGENPFKARAYYNAAWLLDNLTPDQQQLINEGKLGNFPGSVLLWPKKYWSGRLPGPLSPTKSLKPVFLRVCRSY